MKRGIKLFLLMLCVFLMAGSIKAYAEGFTISPKKVTVNAGDSLKLEVSGTGKVPVWVSYNENVAKVDKNGTVTAVRKGKTTVRARSGFMISACAVNVVDSSIKLNKTTATMYYGGTSVNTLQLKATVKGATKNLTWESSNKDVAMVDSNGKVTSVSEGTAVITATANGKSADCTVTVKESSIALNMDTMQLGNKGTGSSVKLIASVVGSKKNVKWVSSDKTIATVSGGKVTGKKNGTATITATANGISDTCVVTVTDGLVSINEEKMLLYTGGTNQLKTNAEKTDVLVWSSSDESIASVTNGLVTAKREGTAIISVTCKGKTDTCEVTVKDTVTEIKEDTVFLRTKGSDKTYQLDYSVIGNSNTVKWVSSNSSVVSVSKGKLTAKKVGTATVTATANGISDAATVTIEDYIPTIKLNQSSYVLYTNKGNTVALKATVDGNSKIVSWNSSNKSVATVDGKGKVTAIGEGETIISATANNVTAECIITVRESRVLLEKENLILGKGETGNIAVDVIGVSQTIKWSTTNSKIATVKNGVVTAKAYGTADIKVTANGITAICHVNVGDCKHNFVETVTKEPSCIEEGICSYTCSICGYSYTENIPTVEHKWGEWITSKEATETEMGIQTHTCTVCGTEETSFIPVLEHTHKYEETVTEPTCTKDGYTTYKCSCGDIYTDNIVPALGHKWSDWQIVSEPTATESGKKVRVCSVCKSEETEEIPSLSHTHEYKTVVVKATCTEDGYTLYECSCGESYKEDIVPAFGHKWSDWQTVKEATKTEAGKKVRICSVCKTEESEEIPSLDHTHKYKTTVIEATCAEDGYTLYECSCGESYKEDVVPALGHKWSEWEVIKKATEKEAGEKLRICSVCKTEETEVIPATKHTHKYKAVNTVEATCTEDGYTIYECSCGESYRDDIVPASGHKYTKTVIKPTCTEGGYTTYTCSVCGDSYNDDYVEFTGHTLSDWKVTKEPTCLDFGWKVKECTECGLELENCMIDETGHSYDDGVVTKEATCTSDGEKTYTCTSCGVTKTEIISASYHKYGEFETVTKPVDFETFGKAKMVCPNCGEVLFDDLTAVLVDTGNGGSTVMYGYYDKSEAKKCFDITYDYKEANGFLSKSDLWVYEWDESNYNYSCIRVAEMSYLYEAGYDWKEFSYHNRPNGVEVFCGENLTWRGYFAEEGYNITSYTAEEAFDAWMNSKGHRENLEDSVDSTSLAQFTAWIPSWEGWAVFWVQNFY